MLLLSACARPDGYETDTYCSIPLPTVSRHDTEQSIIEWDNYLARVDALCGR